MPIYDITGNALNEAFNIQGESIGAFYDVEGNRYELSGEGESIDEITVMTFNVQRWYGLNAKVAIMESIFYTYGAHILGCQECYNDGGYVPTYFKKSFISEGIQVPELTMINLPYTNARTHIYSEQSPNGTRGMQIFTVTLNNKPVTVMNTHLEIYDSTVPHLGQLAEILQILENESSFIIMGDFNFESKSTAAKEYTDFVVPCINRGYHLANWTPETGFVNTYFDNDGDYGFRAPCDNIITSPDIDILSVNYDQTKINAQTGLTIDHIPVIARIKVN